MSKPLWLLNRDCFDRLIEAFTTEPPPRVITTKEEALLNSAISFVYAPPSKKYWLSVTSHGFMGEDHFGTLRSLYNTLPPMKTKPKPKLRVVKARPAKTTRVAVYDKDKLQTLVSLLQPGRVLDARESSLLTDSFQWKYTPQGDDYWWDLNFGNTKVSDDDINYLKSLLGPDEMIVTNPVKLKNFLFSVRPDAWLLKDEAAGLIESFRWNRTPQGEDYWMSIYKGDSSISLKDLVYLGSLVGEKPEAGTVRTVETDSGKTSRLISLMQVGKKLSEKACEVLDSAFSWKDSPQGYDHWFDLYSGRLKASRADLDYLKTLVVPYNPEKLEFVS